MIFHPFLRPEDVEHERKVITQESWNRFLNEKYLAYEKEITDNVFVGHIHSRFASPLGWPETIAKISQEDISVWHKRHYGKGNFFIVLAGTVEEKHLDIINDFLKDLPMATKSENNFGATGKPKQSRFVKTAGEIYGYPFRFGYRRIKAMSIWMRILNMAGIILLHLALIPLLFPFASVPIVLVVVSVLWTALLGFPSVLPPLLTVIIICDSILFGSVQFSSLYFIGVSYSVSFFMKRTLLGEQSGLGFFVLALFAGIATVGYFFLMASRCR
jgi:hypothetical protein